MVGIHSTVGKRAKIMPDITVETTFTEAILSAIVHCHRKREYTVGIRLTAIRLPETYTLVKNTHVINTEYGQDNNIKKYVCDKSDCIH